MPYEGVVELGIDAAKGAVGGVEQSLRPLSLTQQFVGIGHHGLDQRRVLAAACELEDRQGLVRPFRPQQEAGERQGHPQVVGGSAQCFEKIDAGILAIAFFRMLPSEMGPRQVPGDERWMRADQGVSAMPRFLDAHRVDQHADISILDFGAIHTLQAQGLDALDR